MGFCSDIFNMFIADLIVPHGGDRYIMYTILRDDRAIRRKQEQLELERKEYERAHQKRLEEIRHLEFESMRAKNKWIESRKHREAVEEKAMNYYLSKAGYKTFEELCEKNDLNTRESWEEFVKLNPQFDVCNKKHRIYLLRTNWDNI